MQKRSSAQILQSFTANYDTEFRMNVRTNEIMLVILAQFIVSHCVAVGTRNNMINERQAKHVTLSHEIGNNPYLLKPISGDACRQRSC